MIQVRGSTDPPQWYPPPEAQLREGSKEGRKEAMTGGLAGLDHVCIYVCNVLYCTVL